MHDAHTLGSFRSGISKYAAIKMCYMDNQSYTPLQGGASPPFQVVTMKQTYRQNFSNLPKRLKEPLNSLEGVGKLHLRVPWQGGQQAGGALHGALALSLSRGAGAAAAPVQPRVLRLHRMGAPNFIVTPKLVFIHHGSSLTSARDQLLIHHHS